jgi:hypothetical protein
MNGNATKNYVSRHSSGGGGGGGTSNYNELSNKPKINGVELSGNKTSEELHITSGGGGINFDNLTLVKENFTTLDYVNNVTVANGIVVKLYTHYSDGDNKFDFYILPKQLINLVASGKEIAHSFNSNVNFTITVISHSGDAYNFRLDNDTNSRMDLYTF